MGDPAGHAGTGRTRPLNPSAPPSVPDGERSITPEEAFDAFLEERYGRLVSTVRLIVGDHGIAQDIVQETFARAYLSWRKLWPDGNPGGWVHRVGTNLAISWRRRAVREVRALARLERRTQVAVDPPEVYPELHAAVARLPVRQRTAVSLHYVLGLPVDEVAASMGCRPGTVKSLLHHARAKLRAELDQDEES